MYLFGAVGSRPLCAPQARGAPTPGRTHEQTCVRFVREVLTHMHLFRTFVSELPGDEIAEWVGEKPRSKSAEWQMCDTDFAGRA